MSATPTPEMSGKDLVAALKAMKPADAGKFIAENYTKIKAPDLQQVIAWAQTLNNSGLESGAADAIAKVTDAADRASTYLSFQTDPAVMQGAATKAVKAAIDGKTVNTDLDGDGVTSDKEKAAYDQAKSQYVQDHPGVTLGAVEQVTTKAGIAPTYTTPQWVLTSMQNQPGFTGDLTQVQKDRIVADWNETYGKSMDWTQLISSPQFLDPTSETQNVVQSATLDSKPSITYNVTLPNGRSVPITSDTPGFLNGRPIADVMKAVRYANSFGLTNDKGEVGWQPLDALLKAGGDLAAENDSQYQALLAVVSERSDPKWLNAQSDQKITGELNNHQHLLDVAKADVTAYEKAHPDVAAAAGRSKGGPSGQDVGTSGPVSGVIQKYKDGLTKYGDPTMAYVSALDPALAARMYASGGDILKLDEKDITAATGLLLKGGWDPAKLTAQGFAPGLGVRDFLDNMAAKDRAIKQAKLDAQGPVQTFVDPESVKQDVRSLWNSMFRQDPSPAMQEQFAKEIHRMEQNATLPDASKGVNGTNVDIHAQLQKMLQTSPLYKQLYGNKGNMTDEAYQGQFVNAEQSILGGQMDNQSILTGMGQGKYATTIGAAGVTGLATSNSTFLGNLANAAQVMNNMT